MQQSELQQIVSQFAISGTVSDIRPLGEGLINDTYFVETNDEAPKHPSNEMYKNSSPLGRLGGAATTNYVLQRVNHNVFPDVDMVMRNIGIVTSHIRRKLAAEGETDLRHKVLQFIPLKSDADKLYTEQDGNFWRLMIFVDHSQTKQEVNAESSRAAGEAFGRFQAMLADVPEQLGETIKDFHNMEFRIEQLKQACIEDRAGRFDEPEVQALLEQLGKRAEEMTVAERLYRDGRLPKRVCHCDTKVNNMLFNEDGSEVLCVIDLDTVMPSFIFSDYGDFLRTAANTVAEDSPEFDKIQFRQDIYQAFTEGYLSTAGEFLTPVERQLLPFAVKLFPYMQSVRFLWDYLNGDEYWKCKYPTHNLVRAQNQFHYLERIEEALPKVRVVENVNWPEQYPYKPLMIASVQKSDEEIRLHYYIREKSIRAVADDMGRVWEDSCAEFFIQPADDGVYYNFECNCAGHLLLCAGADRHDRERAPQTVVDSVERWSSLGGECFEERVGETEWELTLRIPKTAFFKHHFQSLREVPLRCNIYKCGDKLSEPHFLSLFPIDTEKPDFHRPEQFQEM